MPHNTFHLHTAYCTPSHLSKMKLIVIWYHCFRCFRQVIISHDVFKYFACPCPFVITWCQRQRWHGNVFACVSLCVYLFVCLTKCLMKYWAETLTKALFSWARLGLMQVRRGLDEPSCFQLSSWDLYHKGSRWATGHLLVREPHPCTSHGRNLLLFYYFVM